MGLVAVVYLVSFRTHLTANKAQRPLGMHIAMGIIWALNWQVGWFMNRAILMIGLELSSRRLVAALFWQRETARIKGAGEGKTKSTSVRNHVFDPNPSSQGFDNGLAER